MISGELRREQRPVSPALLTQPVLNVFGRQPSFGAVAIVSAAFATAYLWLALSRSRPSSASSSPKPALVAGHVEAGRVEAG